VIAPMSEEETGMSVTHEPMSNTLHIDTYYLDTRNGMAVLTMETTVSAVVVAARAVPRRRSALVTPTPAAAAILMKLARLLRLRNTESTACLLV
jgi:hypothetical protein